MVNILITLHFVKFGTTNIFIMVERRGFEPLTPTLPVLCATNCANAPSFCKSRNLSFPTVRYPSFKKRYLIVFFRQSANALYKNKKAITPVIAFLWWVLRDLNPRPSPCKGDALPTELNTHNYYLIFSCVTLITRYTFWSVTTGTCKIYTTKNKILCQDFCETFFYYLRLFFVVGISKQILECGGYCECSWNS